MRKFLLKSYRRIINSIAFYPTIMALLAIFFAIFMLYFEYTETSLSIKKRITVALVTNPESGRLILGTIVGGIISLTVFSFSMVMVVLNTATATLSPRIIPGLVSKKFHQVVLGFYISTIIYSLMMIINIHSEEMDKVVPSLGILFSMIFAIISLGLFVYFIHSISISIQVDYIVQSVYRETIKKMESIPELPEEVINEFNKTNENSLDINADSSGYFKMVDVKSLIKFLRQKDLKIKIHVYRGFFTIKGFPFLSINKPVEEEDKKKILKGIQFYNEELITDHYGNGFKQISEIAVKALSPGINDPGTALKALDMLTLLFLKRMEISNHEFEMDEDGVARIIYCEVPFTQLLYNTLGPIREYGKNDTLVIIKSLELLKYLRYSDKGEYFEKTLRNEVESIIQDAVKNNANKRDKKAINNELDRLNKIFSCNFSHI